MSSRESAIDNPEGVQESMAFMEVSESGGPVGTKGRFERGEKEMPDKGKLTDSVRRDSRTGKNMGDIFDAIMAE